MISKVQVEDRIEHLEGGASLGIGVPDLTLGCRLPDLWRSASSQHDTLNCAVSLQISDFRAHDQASKWQDISQNGS